MGTTGLKINVLITCTQSFISLGIKFDPCNSDKITDLNIEKSCLK